MRMIINSMEELIKSNNWVELSLCELPTETIKKYKDLIIWETVAINWDITDDLYENYMDYLKPYKNIIKYRKKHGFISIREDLVNNLL
jgi:hypothetical protein